MFFNLVFYVEMVYLVRFNQNEIINILYCIFIMLLNFQQIDNIKFSHIDDVLLHLVIHVLYDNYERF